MHAPSKKIAVAAVAAGSLAAGAGAFAAVASHGKGSTVVQAVNGTFAAAKSGSAGPLADGGHHRGRLGGDRHPAAVELPVGVVAECPGEQPGGPVRPAAPIWADYNGIEVCAGRP